MSHIEMMRLAEKVALKSVCKRAQVGAVVITKSGKRYTGYNLNAHNPCAVCEGADGRTLPDVIHAEDHALGFVDESDGAVIYVTRQPCIKCAQLITAAGIKTVYYRDADDKTWGLRWLAWHGVEVDSRWILGQTQDSWADRWQSACDACPQSGDGVCCGGVR